MAGSRVFLTGASGNVGQSVLRELIARGHDVTALVRTKLPDAKGYRPVFGDLTKIQEIAGEIGGAHAIIHCGSPRSATRQSVIAADIEGTAQLLNAWQDGPFVYASSQTVYGIPAGILTENAPVSAGSWYDLGKICNEQQILMTAETRPGPGICLRLPLVFATGARRRDRQFLPSVWDALRAGRPFLFESEATLEDAGSIYIGEKDVGRAFADSLSITTSGAFNFAGGFTTWKALLDLLAEHSGQPVKYVFRAGAVPQGNEFRMPQSRSVYDCRRFTEAAGFQPRQSLDEIVVEFARAEMA